MDKGERHCEWTLTWKELAGRAGTSGRIILKWAICMGGSTRPRSRHAVRALTQMSSPLTSHLGDSWFEPRSEDRTFSVTDRATGEFGVQFRVFSLHQHPDWLRRWSPIERLLGVLSLWVNGRSLKPLIPRLRHGVYLHSAQRQL
jgi:hypothetical protein